MRFKKYSIVVFLGLIFVIILFGIYQFNDREVSPTNQWVVANNDLVINETSDLLEVNRVYALQSEYQNTDIKGIISIENEDDFVYPVAQTSDNDYYLNHTYNETYDSLGAIYADYRINLDTSDKVLIYGHSSTKREVPFNKLEEYYDEEYYQNHKYITLETETNIYKYEIFSVYVETFDFIYMNIMFDTKNDWYRHILGLQNKSMYDTNVKLSSDDDILILQTCSNNPKYQKYSKKYLLIVSRRVK